jgi:dTDP-4-dehydrorhamnose reductase
MKILVTGITGYVGRIISEYFGIEHDIYGTSVDCQEGGRNFRCDLRNENEVRVLSDRVQPDLVIHAAGQKDISFCENHPDEAFAINSHATENVARVFGQKNRILYISTDYVFDGKTGYYAEDDIPSPLTVYGKSKLSGEQQGFRVAAGNFCVIRTAALYNEHSKFIEYLTNNLSSGQSVFCFTDTYYSPTYYVDLLTAITSLLGGSYKREIYHVSGSRTSRYEFALLVAQAFNYNTALVLPDTHSSQNWYLLPDLSLSNALSLPILGTHQTSHLQALQTLASKRVKL